MSQPSCTDEEFIELWRTHGSATIIAKVLGIASRNVHDRRRRVEKRHGVQLGATAHPERSQYYKHLSPEQYKARRQFQISDGTVICWSDAHFWPGVRTTAFRALLMFIRELKPFACINNGDSFDGASISRHPRIGWDSKPSVIEELKACQERLGEIAAVANGAQLHWPVGNHDARFCTRLAANAPEFQGVKGFELKDHFPDWIPSWSVWINDDVVVKHRFRSGVHATHNNTVNSGKSIVTGHLHSLKVTPFDDYNGTRYGVDLGTLADPDGPQFQDYLETSPTNWRSGFVVLTFHKGRLLWPEVVKVHDFDSVQFRGTVIDVSKE